MKNGLNGTDTAGQTRFRSITEDYLRRANAYMIVIDLTRRETLDTCDEWFRVIETKGNRRALLFGVGSKSDLVNDREVSFDEARDYFASKGATYYEVSARTGQNVVDMFKDIFVQCCEGSNENV